MESTKFKRRYADMDEEKRRELEEYTKKDVEIEAFLFEKLLPLIPNPDTELPLATQTLHLFLNPQIEIDAEMGNKLKRQMTVEELKPLRKLRLTGVICPDCKGADTTYLSYKDGRCERCGGLGKIMNTPLKEISGNLSFVKLLNQELPENEQIPVKPGKNGMIPALAREDEGMRYLLNHQKETVRLLAEARLAIKSWPLHIKRVDNLMEQAGCRGGKIGAPLSYYAGHLGRWGGTEKINLQNLGGRGRGGFDIHPLIGQIRQMLKAPDGFVFGVADFSQIEARVLAWLAEQDDLVQGFAEGRDVYSEFGNESFGWQVRKPKKDDPKPLYQELLIKRGFCKDTILGAGYGMGANKFYRRSYANQNLRPAFDSGEYDWDFINHLIKSYRTRYAMIPRFWQQVEKAWKFVTKYPKETLELPKNLKFWYEDRATFIGLPSDRFIRYPYASINKQDDLLYRWGKLWGGSITENIVQAVARDVMAVSLLRLQDAGYNIVLHVHDEIVCLLNESSASLWLEGMAHLMSSPIEWAVGLPIAVETKLVERYEK
jgi:DNA polymerase